jgi:hypothetical protein
MTSPAVRSETRIDHGCSAALCEEMGDRLRIALARGPSGLPHEMMVLVEQIARTDGGLPHVAPEAKKQNGEVAQ